MRKDAGWLAIPAAAFLLSSSVSLWSFLRHFEGGLSHEFCNYAEIGRNLASGKGLVTGMVYPFTLALLDARGIPFEGAAPVLDRFPLHAALNAAAIRLGGAEDAPVATLSILLLGLVAGGTSAAGLLLFGPLEAALAGAFVALNPSFQRAFVLWGQPDFGFAALVLALTLLLAEPAKGGAGRWLGAGALAGLAWLERANLSLWLPVFALWLGLRRGGPRRLAWFAAGAALCAAPAMLYYRSWYGSLTPPTASWNLAHHVIVDTPPWLHYRVFEPFETLSGHGHALARKFAHLLRLHLASLPSWWQMTLVFPAALLGAWELRREKDSPARRWAALAGAMLALQIVAFSFLRFETLGPRAGGRYFLWAAPAFFLLAAHAAKVWGTRLKRPALVPGLFAAAVLAVFLHGLGGAQGAPAYPKGVPVAKWPEFERLRAETPPDAVVATNLPGQVVWYAERAAIALPAEPADLLRIHARRPIHALLLSRLRLGELENTPAWRPLLAESRRLEAFAKAGGWKVARDFDTSVLLVPAKPRAPL